MATAPQGMMEKPRFGPSDRLEAAFRASARDPTETIARRLTDMLQMFLQHLKDEAGEEKTKEQAEKCCDEAQQLYYKLLDSLISQREKLDTSNICAFWEHDVFQRTLVACSLEISLTSNNLSSHFFKLLHIFDLKPYHFLRMIAQVLTLSVDLPPHVLKHLKEVGQKIVESLAWTSDSPLWGEMEANGSHLPTCQQVMLPADLEGLTAAESQHELPPEEPESSQSAVEKGNFLCVFARMVYRMMSDRLRRVCSMLNFSDELHQKIWTCFEHSLVTFNPLMKNNDLDTLLLCAVYLMAQVTKREISFACIIESFNKLPHKSKDVSENVLISGGVEENPSTADQDQSSLFLTPNSPSSHHPGPSEQKKLSLRSFYNQVYAPSLQRFAERFTPTSGADTPLSPYPRQRKTPAGKKQIPGFPSISISSFDPGFLSPGGSRLSYIFALSPSERLRDINDLIRTGHPPNKPACAKQLYVKEEDEEEEEEEEEEGEDGPSTKKICLTAGTAFGRRLTDVMVDRATGRNQDQV